MRAASIAITSLALVAFLPYACANPVATAEDDTSGPTSTSSTSMGGDQSGPGPSSGGGTTTNSGGNSAGGNSAGGNSAGGNSAGGNGSGGQMVCDPVGHCETCAEAECSSEWSTCCNTTGCIDLSRCVFEKCDADPLALACINAMCPTEYAAAGSLGGPGSLAGLALGNCLNTELSSSSSTACTCCDQQINGTGGAGGAMCGTGGAGGN